MDDGTTRNAIDPSGDDLGEMTRHPRLDDRATDALFSGRLPADREDLADVAALAERLRSAASHASPPAPSPALAAVLTDGLSSQLSDRPATVGSDAPTAALPVAGRPNPTRTRKMLELLLAKLAGISLLAKTGIAGAAVVAASTGAGLTGNLPVPAQGAFDRAFGEAPAEELDDEAVIELVVEETDTTDEGDTDAGGRPEVPGAEGRATADENAGDDGAEGRATADEAATDGRAFGERRASEAREDAPAGPETGEDASSTGRQTAEDAATAGKERAADAPHGDADTGDDAADGAGPPEEVPAGSRETGEATSSSAKERTPPAGRP